MKCRIGMFLVLSIAVVGITCFISTYCKAEGSLAESQVARTLTESETAEILIKYLCSQDENVAINIISSENLGVVYEWESEDETIAFQVSEESEANNERYYVFGYYSRENKEAGYKYYSCIDYYAVNRETGEIIAKKDWNKNNDNQLVCDRADGMSEKEAAQTFYDSIFGENSFEKTVTPYIHSDTMHYAGYEWREGQHVAYEWWKDDRCNYYFWGNGLAEDKSWYIFEYWYDICDRREGTEIPIPYISHYIGMFAVNKYSGEVIQDRFHDTGYGLQYNKEFSCIVKPYQRTEDNVRE